MENRTYDFYANATDVTTTAYDITLRFRTQTPMAVEADTKEQVFEVSGMCNVRMSPQHAKSLAAILAKHVVDYEMRYDVRLPVPDTIVEIWDHYVEGGK